jgi:uncharacterized membrane protein
MNGAHLHLLLNHIPVLGSIFAVCLLTYGVFFKNQSLIKAALVTVVVAALFSIPVFLSGEEAENILEGMIGISHDAIEHHEDHGSIAFWSMLMCGAIALGALLSSAKTKIVSRPLQWINLVMLIIVVLLMARAAYSGGEIRHTEIQINHRS